MGHLLVNDLAAGQGPLLLGCWHGPVGISSRQLWHGCPLQASTDQLS